MADLLQALGGQVEPLAASAEPEAAAHDETARVPPWDTAAA
jgi:hypothetical protein